MSDLFPVAGARMSIGGVLASKNEDFDAADFTSQTWTEIDGWETMGAIGDASEMINTPLINRGRNAKQKGTRDAGDMENNFAILPTDAGQIAARAAEATKSNYAFKIVYDDAPEGGTATTQYFIALVTSAREAGGGANTVRMFAVTLGVNSNIVTVPAAGA